MQKDDIYSFIDSSNAGNKVTLRTVADFIEETCPNISVKELYEVVENSPKIQMLIDSFITKNKSKIITNGFESISNSPILISLFNVYCDLNDINLYQNMDQKISEYANLSDSLGMYIKEIEKFPILSKKEMTDLFNEYHCGNLKAKEKLINCNLKLAVYFASSFANSFGKQKDLLDFIQVANAGLITAVERFDVDKNKSFSTYAYFWIRFEIYREIKTNRQIYLPTGFLKYIRIYHEFSDEYFDKYGRFPSDEIVMNNTTITKEYLKLIKQHEMEMLSIHQRVNVDSDTTYEEFIPSDDEERSLEESVIYHDNNEFLTKLIDESSLTPREKKVIYRRIYQEETLQVIADDYNLTRERIRQIEEKSLKKLRKQLAKYKEIFIEE